jgi:hypothetical protein
MDYGKAGQVNLPKAAPPFDPNKTKSGVKPAKKARPTKEELLARMKAAADQLADKD